MPDIFECPEKSSFNLKLALTDEEGNDLINVDKIEWWVGRPRQETPIIDKTDVIDPSYDSVILIPAEANICEGQGNEERFIIIRVEAGDHIRHKQFDYVVINLGLVPYEG